jgi:hypothetical protein
MEGVAQAVEHLLCKVEALSLSSNPQPYQKKKKKKNEEKKETRGAPYSSAPSLP